MPSGNETTTKFKVDISELKKGIQDANRLIRLANAEFKSASASMDDWSKSTSGLSAKITQTEQVLKAQKTILNSYKDQLALIVAEYGENSKEADEMRIRIENQRATVIRTQRALGEYESQLAQLQAEQSRSASSTEEQSNAYDALSEKVKEQKTQLQSLKDEYANVVLTQGAGSEEAQRLAGQIGTLSEEVRTNEERLREASEAADEFDHTLENVDEEAENTSSGGISAFAVAIGNLVSNVIQNAIGKLKELASETINVGRAFDTSMSQVGAVSGATGDELQRLRDKAKEMGSTTKFTASEAADAFNYMAMAGWKTEDMISGIDGVLNLAAASGADLATTSDIVTDALTAMGYSAGDAGRLADVMAAASSNANTNVEMMGETFKYAAPLVGAMGYSMEDTAVAVGLMANAGIKASSAGTALRGTLSRLAKPTKQMKTMMDQLGLTTQETITTIDSEKLEKAQNRVASQTAAMEKAQINYNAAVQNYGESSDQARKAHLSLENAERSLAAANKELEKAQEGKTQTVRKSIDILKDENGEMRSLMDVMELLRDKVGGLGEAEQAQAAATLFGQEAMSGMLAIINASDEDFNKLTQAVEGSEGAAEQMAETMLNNLGGDMTLLSSKIEGVQLAIYEKFEPALRKGVDALSKLLDVVQFVVDHSAEFTAALAAMGAAIATYIGFTTALKVMRDGWAALTIVTKVQAAAQAALNAVTALSPWMWVVTGIMALVAAFVVLWNKSEKFRQFWFDLWDSIQEVAGKAIEAVAGFFSGVWESIKKIWGGVSEWFAERWNKIRFSVLVLRSKIEEAFIKAKEKVQEIWNTVANWFSDNVVEPIKSFFAPLIDFFKTAWKIIEELAVGCWNAIKAIWSVVSEWFSTNVIQPVSEFFTRLWNGIKTAASAAWNAIKVAWAVVSEWFKVHIIQPLGKFFSALWNGIKTAASTAWNGIKAVWNVVSGWFDKTIIQPVSKFFTGMWDGLKKGASDAWSGIKSVFSVVSDWFKDVFSKAWQKVKDVFSTGGKVFDGIKDGIVSAFKTVVNAIIRGINKVVAVPFNAINDILDTLQTVSIAGIEPFSGLVHRLPVPEIPLLSQGGVLKRGQVGLLEGNGAEAVVPLENNKRWIAATAAELRKALFAEGIIGVKGGTSGGSTTYTFNQYNTSPKALSRLEIYRQSKNLLRMKGAT